MGATATKQTLTGKTQFEITSSLLRNLYKFNLTPVTKLVLLELTTHLGTNGSVVFPSVGYISEVLGIGLTAAKKAINDLVKEGLIIKSKRDKVRGNCNKYLLTPKVTSEQSENELLKQSDSDLFMIINNKEQIKQQRVNFKVENIPQKYSNQSGGNVSDSILREYARKHGARNIDAYVTALKKTKSAEKIIKEEHKIVTSAVATLLETQNLIQNYKDDAKKSESYETSAAWKELGKKFGFKK